MTPEAGQLDWLAALGAAREAGEACVLVTIAASRGSSPREAGAKMLVRRDGGFSGTIGGGRLEHRALARAAALIADAASEPVLERIALGPALGQCCGGEVTLLFEPFAGTALHLALFGAGHVGRAVVEVLAGLPVRIDWIDPRAGQFPALLPPGVRVIVADPPADEVADLPPGCVVVAMTHGHDLDFAIAAAAIARGDLPYVGVIGSATKAARFRARLAQRGLDPARLTSPIGAPGLRTKHPRAVAIALAAELLARARI
jgi:xanthine dehydrogenase accessory factor